MTGRGLFVLTSCSHRGLINTVRAAMSASGIDDVFGLHGAEIVNRLPDLVERRHDVKPTAITWSSATAPATYDLVGSELGNKVIHLAASMLFVFTSG